jgi:hypothetical protein
MVLDASIEDIFVLDFKQRVSTSTLLIYTLIVLLFSAFQYLIIRFLIYPNTRNSSRGSLNLLFWIMVLAQSLLTAVSAATIIEMAFDLKYNIYLILVIIWTSYSLSILMLGALAYKFFLWFKVNRNFNVLFYALSIIMLSINGVFTSLYLSVGLSTKPLHITPFIDPLGAFSNSDVLSSTGYNVTNIVSFILIWVSTVILLYHYSSRVGKAKYWLIVSIPLLYFIIQFQGVFVDTLQGFRLQNPFIYNTAFILVFNSTNPTGGVLFGLAFWTIARNINNVSLRIYLTASAIGLMLFFGTNHATTLISAPYPPFGIPSVSFVGLASYLILMGFYYSALSVAKDDQLRRNIRKSIQQESKLLHSIATAEVEEELTRKVSQFKSILDRADQERLAEIEPSLDDLEIRKYIQDVLRETRQVRNGQKEE